MADTIPGGPHPTANDTNVTPGSSQRHCIDSGGVPRSWFRHLQALEDAIAYRRARAAAPCPDCTASGQKCDDLRLRPAADRRLPADRHRRHRGPVQPRRRLPGS